MVNRKSFLRLASMSVGALATPGLLAGLSASPLQSFNKGPGSPLQRALADLALTAALAKGASYADVRVGRISNDNGNIQSQNVCVRVLVAGKWGYATTSGMHDDAISECVEKAVASAAKSNASLISERHQYDLRIPCDLWRCSSVRN